MNVGRFKMNRRTSHGGRGRVRPRRAGLSTSSNGNDRRVRRQPFSRRYLDRVADHHFLIYATGGARVARRALEEAERAVQALRVALTINGPFPDDRRPLTLVCLAMRAFTRPSLRREPLDSSGRRCPGARPRFGRSSSPLQRSSGETTPSVPSLSTPARRSVGRRWGLHCCRQRIKPTGAGFTR